MNDLTQMVANQMMKGPNYGRLPANKKQQAAFLRRHEDKIRWVLDKLPTHKRASAAVPAVICKALIVYGVEKTEALCAALTKLKFQGPDDPAHLLWLYLLKNSARDEKTVEVYRKTICAVRAYMEGRKIDRISPIKTDIFEWDEDYTLPDDLLNNNDEVDLKILEQRVIEKRQAVEHNRELERIKQEVEEAIRDSPREERGLLLPAT
jgi:hypothetical protein